MYVEGEFAVVCLRMKKAGENATRRKGHQEKLVAF
jgi:hypothetical protein